jgi:hypothetical protein
MRALFYRVLWKEAKKRSCRETRMKPVLYFSYLLLLVPMSVSAQMDHTHSSATAEDCTRLPPELQEVVAAMDGPGSKIEALPKSEISPAIAPGMHKLEVVLRPLAEVGLLGKESLSRETLGRKDAIDDKTKPSENVENLFGGFVRLTVPKDGIYRISVDSALWIEMIDGGKPIERVRTVPRLHCGRIHKSLGFPLKQERSYWLEMSGSKRPEVALLITED